MTSKEYLEQGLACTRRIRARRLEVGRLRFALRQAEECADGRVSERTRDRLIALAQEVELEINDLCAKEREVYAAIDSVKNEKLRAFLDLRYRGGMSLEQIAREMHYSYTHTARLHREALKAVQVPKRRRGRRST